MKDLDISPRELYEDKEYIEMTIRVLEDNLDDLEKISVYNDDILNIDLTDIKIAMNNIKDTVSKI